MTDVRVKRLYKEASFPAQGSAGAAGYHLRARVKDASIKIEPGETVMLGTGLSMEVPEGYFLGIFARSGLAVKQGLRPPMCVGIIDSDYRGEIMTPLHNDSKTTQEIHNGDRLAQAILIPCATINFIETDELKESERGTGGFGSTGIE